jgi:hypothetical protein
VLTVGLNRNLMLVGVKTVLFHITRKYQIIRAVCNERVLCAIAFRAGSSNWFSSGNPVHPHLSLSQQVLSTSSWTIVIHMFKKFTAFSATEGALLHSQKPIPGSRSDLDKSNLHLHSIRL